MVCIKLTARPQTLVVSPMFASMVSNGAPKIFVLQREILTEQPEESLAGQQMVASMEAASEQDAESDRESQSSDSGDSETASNNSRRVKVAAAAALARISYNFRQSIIPKTCLGFPESNTRYFPKGYGRPLGMKSVPDPRVIEAMVFEDFFTAGLRIPPHPILVDILHKF
jgi:hypothetical protein